MTERQTADLRQGNGPQQGYVIFGKGSDQLIVSVTTTMKDGQPNTTMKGTYAIVSTSGALAGMQGAGNYFTAEDKYHIDVMARARSRRVPWSPRSPCARSPASETRLWG